MASKSRIKGVRTVSAIAWLLCVMLAAMVVRPYVLSYIDAAFIVAVRHGNSYEVERLLALGADPNGYRNGVSLPLSVRPLADGAQHNYVSVVRILLQHGANASIHPNVESPAL